MKDPLRVAVFQMETAFDVSQNARKMHAALDRARDEQAGLLVVPECALSGYIPEPDLDFGALEQAEAELAAHSAEAGVWLALGTTRSKGVDWFNAVRLYSPTGAIVAAYDKTHLIGGDRETFAPGASLPVFQAGAWTVGIQVCFDMRFPENWRILRRKGAELVIHLSNASRSAPWKVPVLAGAVRSRAAENGMFVASANDARAPQMMVSAIYDPDGKELASAPENEEAMIFADLDRSLVKADFLEQRRTDLWNRPENRSLLLS